jgi:hypothetical protein
VVQAQEGETDPQIEVLTQRVAALEAESALLKERISQLESDPLVRRMKRDQVAQDLKAEVPGIGRLIAPNWSGGYLGWLTGYLELYVLVYMASACLVIALRSVSESQPRWRGSWGAVPLWRRTAESGSGAGRSHRTTASLPPSAGARRRLRDAQI